MVRPEISVIIPAYNEEKRIGSTLKSIQRYLIGKSGNKGTYELIVIDDGSKDKTRRIVKSFKGVGLNPPRKNLGKGASVQEGLRLAKGKKVLFSDADLSTPIRELDKFIPFLGEFDMVIASRALKDSIIPVRQPWYRELLGKTFNKFVQVVAVPGIKDTQCGFKLYTQKAAKHIASRQTIKGFGFDVEQLFIARKGGLKVKELPVTWNNAEGSKVKVVRDSLRMLRDLGTIRLNHLKGAYR